MKLTSLKKGVSFLLYIVSKIDSLFKGRVYLFNNDATADDLAFAEQLLRQVRPSLCVRQIHLIKVEEDYDVFEIEDEEGYFFRLKISLEAPCPVLKREAIGTKKTLCPSSPVYVKHGVVEIGEKISYLLVALPFCRPLREVGRSLLLESFPSFLDCYKEFQDTEEVKTSYKTVLKQIFDGLNLSKVLPEDVVAEVREDTNYDLCINFSKELERRTFEFFSRVEYENSFKCHGNFSLDSVLCDGQYFYFDSSPFLCMAHPFIDLVDLILDWGCDKDTEKTLVDKMAETLQISSDAYDEIYQMCLGKKIAQLLSAYIKEVYLYNCYRQEKLIAIADSFSQCYERFCSIDIFNENRHFILKTITEPIIGVNS